MPDNAIKAVKGVKDILPANAGLWREVERRARAQFARFGFKEIVLPIFEKTEVFVKGVGEETDIVQKEMYTFQDQGGESLTLRPEGTASCVRAFIEHSMYHPPGTITKLYYFGPMFRRERPQAGRFRQFYQVGAELFGAAEPEADAEAIHLLWLFIQSINIKGPRLYLNSLGCDVCRPPFRAALVDFLAARKERLCETCQGRYERNPLRVFDCKAQGCQQVMTEAPTIDKHYCPDCQAHFARVKKGLDALAIPCELNPRMVRGLDYYNRTVFEVTAEGLGSQNSIAGGGRYDDLIKNSGGPAVPAIGFALGVERLLESIGAPLEFSPGHPDVFIVYMEAAADEAFRIAGRLRQKGIAVEKSFKPASLKNQMGRADKSGARFALIIGEEELSTGVAILKDLKNSTQQPIPLDNLEESLAGLLAIDAD